MLQSLFLSTTYDGLLSKIWFIVPAALVACAISAYVYRYMTKPRFSSKAVLYLGDIKRNGHGRLVLKVYTKQETIYAMW